MGACIADSKPSVNKELNDKANTKDEPARRILIWGSKLSGRSTLFRQFAYISNENWCTDEDHEDFQQKIHQQIGRQIKHILDILYPNDPSEFQGSQELFNLDDWNVTITNEIAEAIKDCWNNDQRMRDLFRFDNELRLNDNNLLPTTEYFLDKIDEIVSDDYIPTKQDILMLSARTTGCIEKRLVINEMDYRVYDVQPRGPSRNKWMYAFEAIDIFVYMVSLSDYNESLRWDEYNAMEYAMDEFDKAVNLRKMWSKTPVILLLNKTDIFEQKISHCKIPITSCPRFKDDDDFDEFAMRYKGIVFLICNSFCADSIDIDIPMEIKNVVIMFTGYGLNIYDIDEDILSELQCNKNFKMKNDEYDYELCKYYIKYKFEALDGRENKSDKLFTYFTCALDSENMEFMVNEIISKMPSKQFELLYDQ